EEEAQSSYVEKRYIHTEGHVVWALSSISLVRDSQGNPSHFVSLFQDITERKALEEQLRHQAFYDSLTGLPNRALLLDRLEEALDPGRREGSLVTLLLVDLDDFKVVNDSLGHDTGNVLLLEVAKRLQASVRPGDTVARLSGDEFVVLLETTNLDEGQWVSERIQKYLQEPFEIYEREVFVSPSIGIALTEGAEYKPKELLRHADLAMYAAKKRGKAQYEFYSPSMDTQIQERMHLESDLRRAVKHGELEVHYQPMIELHTGRICAFEALARWRHPERGLLAAEEFIQNAEETGLIRPVGLWVLEEACQQGKEWREHYPDRTLLMSVNFAASQFSHQAHLISKVLSNTGLDPKGLQLEITERAVMDDAELSIEKLKKLKALGVRFAIDDYGMGYSCLYYLKRMPVNSLKIDQSFIAGLGKDRGDTAIVSGTIAMAHDLGLKIVAEGVGTAYQLAQLKELGCDLGQGLHLGEPLASEAVAALLNED
ncbi:MAG: EAL domain-containing protein, partial [Rubrobacter sp.]|nr:EAL domain-containing protein [Rubrobacter sp.]